MPYSSNSGGPWGGGDDKEGGKRPANPWGTPGGTSDDRKKTDPRPKPQSGVPEIDDFVRKGQEQLKVLMGGKGGGGGGRGPGGGGGAGRPELPGGGRAALAVGAIALVGVWLAASFYTVRPEEKSVELMLGKFSEVGESGLNFAPWPLVTKTILPVSQENSEQIGMGGRGRLDDGLMLTGDENIVDIDFEVVWNISDPAGYLFNLAEPRETIRAVSESAMREVIGRSELAPILNRNRRIISDEVETLIQTTLDSYNSGVNIVRVNFDKADPPREVIDAFRDVQAAEQERDTQEKQADAYANQKLAEARGQAAQLLQQAEGYRASVVNEAQGEASRFEAVFTEYAKAPEVTRKRLYLETMERVLGTTDKILIDPTISGAGGQGIVPYLPLNELGKGGSK